MGYVDEVLADAPVSWWRLGEGGITTDEQPAAATLSNAAVTTTPGLPATSPGLGALFNGSSSVLYTVTAVPAHNLGDGPLTLELWFKRTRSGVLEILIDKGSNAYQLYIGTSGQIVFGKSVVGGTLVSTAAINDTFPHHLVVTKNGAAQAMYLDGVAIATTVTNQTLVDNASGLVLGRYAASALYFFSGVLDEVALYNTVLSAARVAAHYNAGLRAIVGTSRVLAYGVGGTVGTSRVLPYSVGGVVGTSRALLYTIVAPLTEPPATVIRVTKPALGLSAEIRTPEGAGMTWDSHARAEERPRAISFSTRRGEGFGNASLTLSRRVDREYRDLGLLDELILYGEDGSTAFEGRLASSPRSLSDTHTIAPQFVGWMAHARDRKATQIYVDRDVSGWTEMPLVRKASLTAGGTWVDSMASYGSSLVTTAESGSATAPVRPHSSEAWYDAGPEAALSRLYFSAIQLTSHSGSPAAWAAYLASDGSFSSFVASSANPSGAVALASAGRYRYACFVLTMPNTDVRRAEVRWSDIAVYGDHGLPLIGAEPAGVAASEVIAHVITKWCPMLNPGGVKRTTTPIGHLAFRGRTDPYDMMLEANKFHLWNLAVWERRTVHYEPVDLADHDWEVRLSDHGVGLEFQGDSTEEAVYNGIAVSFENVATAGSENGTRDSATPDRYRELRDLSPEHPANRHGYPRWAELELSSPTTLAGALYIGQAKLAELNSPRSPGSITVKGHIRDRAGNWQPVWRVRAGETVAITDHPNTRPRLIVETSYDHDGYALTIGVDSLIPRVEAILDRLTAAQVAVGTLS